MGLWHNIVMILTLRCDESARLLSAASDTPLSRPQRIALRMHLLGCRACRRYRRQLTVIRTAARAFYRKAATDSSLLPPLNPTRKQQMKEALRQKMGDE